MCIRDRTRPREASGCVRLRDPDGLADQQRVVDPLRDLEIGRVPDDRGRLAGGIDQHERRRDLDRNLGRHHLVELELAQRDGEADDATAVTRDQGQLLRDGSVIGTQGVVEEQRDDLARLQRCCDNAESTRGARRRRGRRARPGRGAAVVDGVVTIVPPWATLAALDVATAAWALLIALSSPLIPGKVGPEAAELGEPPEDPESELEGRSATIHTPRNAIAATRSANKGRGTEPITPFFGRRGSKHKGPLGGVGHWPW